MKRLFSLLLASVMLVVTILSSVSAYAAGYKADKADDIATAPTITLDEEINATYVKGNFYYQGKDGYKEYTLEITNKYYTFVPEISGYYEATVTVLENKNRKFRIYWAENYDSKNQTVSHVPGGSTVAFNQSSKGKFTNTAVDYLTAGKTYYLVVNSEVDDVKLDAQSEVKHTIVVKAHTHSYKSTTKKATASAAGKISDLCICNSEKNVKAIAQIKTISLEATSLTYNAKARSPKVIVKDSKGKALAKGTDYTVTYASGRKNVGKYSVKVTFKGNYSGSKTLYFKINPKGTSLTGVTALSKGFTAKWSKQATQTTGYQVQYSISSKFSGAKTVTVSGTKNVSKKVTGLKGKKKYYVRVRTYKTVSGTKYYSAWSKAKTVTTK